MSPYDEIVRGDGVGERREWLHGGMVVGGVAVPPGMTEWRWFVVVKKYRSRSIVSYCMTTAGVHTNGCVFGDVLGNLRVTAGSLARVAIACLGTVVWRHHAQPKGAPLASRW